MAPFRKFRIVERWVNYLPKNKLFQNRKFYTSDELFKLFTKDMGNLTTSMGFVKMINKIAHGDNNKNFRIRQRRYKDNGVDIRENAYIILVDSECDVDLNQIRVNKKRTAVQQLMRNDSEIFTTRLENHSKLAEEDTAVPTHNPTPQQNTPQSHRVTTQDTPQIRCVTTQDTLLEDTP